MLVDRHVDQDLGYAVNEGMRWRLNWRRSNATAPRRNRYRENKVNPPWLDDDFHDMCCAEELCECDDDS